MKHQTQILPRCFSGTDSIWKFSPKKSGNCEKPCKLSGCYSLMVNVFGKKHYLLCLDFVALLFMTKNLIIWCTWCCLVDRLWILACHLCQCLKVFNKFLRLDFGLCLSQTSEVNNSISWCISHCTDKRPWCWAPNSTAFSSTMIVGPTPPRNMASPVGRVAVPVVGSGFYQGFMCSRPSLKHVGICLNHVT